MTQKKEHTHPIREARKILTLALVLALIGALCFGIGFLTGDRGSGGEPKLSSVVVKAQLEQISELATARYNYTNVGKFEDSSEFHGLTIPLTGKRFIVSYDGVILAGIDLEKAEVDLSGRRIAVTLPRAEILSHEIDEDSLKVFDETHNIFNPITLENYNDFQKEQKDVMEEKAAEGGLLQQAEEQAELAAQQVLGPAAEQSDMKLEIKFKEEEKPAVEKSSGYE